MLSDIDQAVLYFIAQLHFNSDFVYLLYLRTFNIKTFGEFFFMCLF